MTEKNLLRISASTKNVENSVIWMPYSYRDTNAAVKAVVAAKREAAPAEDRNKVGGFVKGEGSDSFWFVNKLSDAEAAAITAASEKDVALGKDGRKEREEALKAERDTAKPKKEKVTKSPEEIEAAKAERAEAGRVRAEERNASRVLVDADSVDLGGEVDKDGTKQVVNHIGAAFEKDGKNVAYAYFGDLGAEMADKAAEAEKEEEAAPGM